MAEKPKTPHWGYAKRDRSRIFELTDGEKLPDGWYSHPALVPGSDAERKHKEDAEREGSEVVLK